VYAASGGWLSLDTVWELGPIALPQDNPALEGTLQEWTAGEEAQTLPVRSDDVHEAQTESRCAWYALHTRHQHERLVARSLLNKGFEVFLPQYTVTRRWSDRAKQVSVPLFPCYIFLRGGLNNRLAVLTTPGVHGFVGFAGRAAAIPEEQIDAVRRAAQEVTIEPHPFLRCGDRVRVTSGPLEGVEGVLVRKKNSFRLVLSLELLCRSAAVEVEASAVERVRSPISPV
jgi:transcription antitermination factor NusG